MKFGSAFLRILCASLLTCALDAITLDPYKVLGVERKASQREIQKAFHKLSLQYHPDKNKNKGAQEKFVEINNAYDTLSDEGKRKDYDLCGDEKGNPGFNAEYTGDQGGYSYTHFTSEFEGPGQSVLRWLQFGIFGLVFLYTFVSITRWLLNFFIGCLRITLALVALLTNFVYKKFIY